MPVNRPLYPSGRVSSPFRAATCATALGAALAVLGSCADATRVVAPVPARADATAAATYNHVLLISVDGLHEIDLANYVTAHPTSALAQLAGSGVLYTQASTTRPSDSFPGLLSMVTGGTPRSTGVYYDVSYDRRLSPPGSTCGVRGTVVAYDESIDYDLNDINAGGGINPANLPRDPDAGCTPVYPHQFLKVNTIFEVAHRAGLRTAWVDKHPAYEILNGPSGTGVTDLYTPEIAANNGTPTADVADAIHYDTRHVKAVVNEIDGFDHTGATRVGVPALFGMNFQAVSVGQKTAGYTDASGTPSVGLATALDFVDASLGRFLTELTNQGLRQQTLVIVSAKHGQAPINRGLRRIVNDAYLPAYLDGIVPNIIAASTEDDVALLWLSDSTRATTVANALRPAPDSLGVDSVIAGAALQRLYGGVPGTASRIPDVVVVTKPGVIYAGPRASKLAEHGGFSDDDAHVPILVSAPGIAAQSVATPVTTTQIGPTILRALGLDPSALQAATLEGTQVLPSLTSSGASIAAVRRTR